MKLEFSQHIFEKYSNIKFHENLCSGTRVVPCGRTDRQTAMTKLVVSVRYSANAHKSCFATYQLHCLTVLTFVSLCPRPISYLHYRCWQCNTLASYPYNKYEQDALFIFNLFQ